MIFLILFLTRDGVRVVKRDEWPKELEKSGSQKQRGGEACRMQIEIKIDSNCSEPKVIVVTDKITDRINTLIKKITDETPQLLSGFQGEKLEILDQYDIFRIYAANGKVCAVTGHGEYLLRLRLYELEERLDKASFVRISNSEIINLKKVKMFDLSYAGTICVSLTDDSVTYVSRRYVAKIKQVLGI